MGFNHAQNINSFRIFKKKLMEHFKEIQNPKINIDVLLSWSTQNFTSIYVEHNKKKGFRVCSNKAYKSRTYYDN